MVPIVNYLDSSIKCDRDLPDDIESLRRSLPKPNGSAFPELTYYVKMGRNSYTLHRYFAGRVSLWYLSNDDGWQHAGWWIDDDSGDAPVPYNPPKEKH